MALDTRNRRAAPVLRHDDSDGFFTTVPVSKRLANQGNHHCTAPWRSRIYRSAINATRRFNRVGALATVVMAAALAGCSPTGQWDWGLGDQDASRSGSQSARRRAWEARRQQANLPPPEQTSWTKNTGGFKLDFFKPARKLIQPKGHRWTILCIELPGTDRRQDAESIAKTLQRTGGVVPGEVLVKHDDDASRVYYGSYWRREVDATGKLNVPPKMAADMELVKTLAGPAGGRFFYEARVVPYPTPDVGNPEWQLANNPGVYTLRVAIFYNEGKMTERKKYAADYCAELRNRGYEAYYRHGEITSEVYVGSFSEDALIRTRRSGVAVYVPSPKVQALQRKENFMYELWNMKVFSSAGKSARHRRASHVVRVSEALGRDDALTPPA